MNDKKFSQQLLNRFSKKIDEWDVDTESLEGIMSFFEFGDTYQVAHFLKVNHNTMYNWIKKAQKKKEYKQFVELFEKWETKRNAFLFQIVPHVAKVTPSLAIFLMKVHLGYQEIQRHEVKEDKKPQKIKIVVEDKIIQKDKK